MRCTECNRGYFSDEKSRAYFGLCDECGLIKLKSAASDYPFNDQELTLAEVASWAMSGSRPQEIKRGWRVA